MSKREHVTIVDGQLDVFEVIADVKKNGLVPNPTGHVANASAAIVGVDCARNDIDTVVVKVGMEFIVMVNGERANDKRYWSQIECYAFIDGLHART